MIATTPRIGAGCLLLVLLASVAGIGPGQAAVEAVDSDHTAAQRPDTIRGGSRLVAWGDQAPAIAPVGHAACDVRGTVDTPAEAAEVPSGPLVIRGWAADVASATGTGVGAVRVALDAPPEQGGQAVTAPYGEARLDVAAALNDPRFTTVGFSLTADGSAVPAGPHVLYVELETACGWTTMTRPLTVVAGAGSSAPAAAQGSAALALSAAVASTPTPAPSPTSTMPAPTNLTAASSPMGDAVTVSWTPPPITVFAYRIVLHDGNGGHRPLLEVPGSQVQATLRGLDPRLGYSFAVLAVDRDGETSAPSSPISNAGAPMMTPLPTPTPPPWCTPEPAGGAAICSGGPWGPPGLPIGPYPPGSMVGGLPVGAIGLPGAGMVGGAPSPTLSQLVVPSGPVPAGSPLTITALVRDAKGLPLPGVLVAATVSPPGATLTPLQPTTDSAGSATFQLTGPAGTAATISGTANGVPLPPAVVTFTP
jgi:hypothetical protein